jgi:hypothetical protein
MLLLPVPLVAERVIQEAWVLTCHRQEVGVPPPMNDPVPPSAEILSLKGNRDIWQAGCCVTLNVFPPTLTVAFREETPVFGSTL